MINEVVILYFILLVIALVGWRYTVWSQRHSKHHPHNRS